MGSFDLARKRLEASGGSFREATHEASKEFFDDVFDDYGTYDVELIRGHDESTRKKTNCRIYEFTAAAYTQATGIKKFALPLGTEIRPGDYIVWDGTYWMVTFDLDYNEMYVSGVIMQCTYIFKWIDAKDYTLKEYWGVEINKNSYSPGVWSNFYSVFVDTEKACYLPTIPDINRIFRDRRFIISYNELDPKVYKASRIDDTRIPGITIFGFVETEYNQELDDAVNGIADAYLKREITIEFENGGAVSVRPFQSAQISVKVYSIDSINGNTLVVDSPEVEYSIVDGAIARVSPSGTVTGISVGSTSVLVSYGGTSATIIVRVENSAFANVYADLTGRNVIYWGQRELYQAAIYENGSETANIPTFELLAIDSVSPTTLAFLETNGNSAYVTANNNDRSGKVLLRATYQSRVLAEKLISVKSLL